MDGDGSRKREAAEPGGRGVLLVAKSAFAAAPRDEMRRIASMVQSPGTSHVRACFSEQGEPSIRDALFELRGAGCSTILVVPLMLPVEPGFRNWLRTSLRRWQAEEPGDWPPVRIARDIAESRHFQWLLADLVSGEAKEAPVPPAETTVREGSLVPPQKRRVLVCAGRACNAVGAEAIWCHLRNRQQERRLRVTGDGTMTAKSTCLGPCSLAPVLQVFPERGVGSP